MSQKVIHLTGSVNGTLGEGKISFDFKFNSSITPPPTDKKVSLNHATQNLATKMYVSVINDEGADIGDLLRAFTNIGDKIVVFNRTNAGQRAVYDVTAITDQTTYIEYGVTFDNEVGAVFTNNQKIVVAWFATSVGGAGDVTAANPFGTDNLLIRSDGIGKGVQGSGISVDDTDEIEGATIDADLNTIINIGRAEFDADTNRESANLDGLAFDKLDLVIVDDGGLQLDVEKIGGGDARALINGVVATLDCTTGSGVGGKARIALTEGSDVNNPEINWIYATQAGGVISLNVSTGINLPTGAFVWIAKIIIPDSTTWTTSGAYGFQRFTEAFSNDSRGTQSHTREKLRALGAVYIHGVAQTLNITVNGGSPDNVHLATTAGEVYQLHRQTFPAFATGPYFYGNGTDIYEEFADLNAVLTTIDNSVIGNNDRFNLIVWGAVNITSGECKLFINKAEDVYGNDSQALADINNTSDYSVPDGMRSVGFMISRIVMKYSAGDSGTWTELGVFSLLGVPVGVRVGGTTSVANNEFSDAQFRVFDDGDDTKEIAFEASEIAAGQTRVLTVPDKDVRLGTFPILQPRTGSTITFDDYAEYNAITPITSGNITITPTGAIAGAYVAFYFNGSTEPTISGATGQLVSGDFVADELNIYHFFWNTNGNYVLNIQTGEALTQLTTPTITPSALDTQISLAFTNIDVNATLNVLDKSLDDINWVNVTGYDGTNTSYLDIGLTNGQIYYYRLKSQASGFADSDYGTANETPVASGYSFGNAIDFTLATQKITLDNSVVYTNQMSMGIWFRIADFSGANYLLAGNDNSYINIISSTRISLRRSSKATAFDVAEMSINTWYCLMFGIHGSTGEIFCYLNAVLVSNGGESFKNFELTSFSGYFASQVIGQLDNFFLINNYTLTQQDADAFYNGGAGADVLDIFPTADAVYDFNTSTGLILLDKTVNANNGTCIGFAGDDSQWVAH